MKASARNKVTKTTGAKIFFLAMSVCFLFLFIRNAWQIDQAKKWPSIDAEVINSEIILTTNAFQGKFGFRLTIDATVDFKFSYTIGGRSYTSANFYFIGQPPAYALARNYPLGGHFMARYNPSAPSNAIVEPGPLCYRFLALSGAFFACVLCCVGYDKTIKLNHQC